MAKTSLPTGIPADFWRQACTADPEIAFEQYLNMYHHSFKSAYHPPPKGRGSSPRIFRDCLKECHERLKKRDAEDLCAGAARQEVDDMLELGTRLACGVLIPFDEDAAIALFKKIAEGHYPKDKQAIAASLLCQCLTRKFILGLVDTPQFLAPFPWAEMSCKLGLFTHASLHLAMIYDGSVDDADKDGPLAEFTHFWGAYHKFCEDTGLQRGNARRCAACDKKHERRSSLKKCAGDCPSEAKPVYCSRRCQKAHWPKHRQWCKPDPAESDPEWTTDSESQD